ncbi:leucine-rich repeat-containing protein 40-like [Ciona intestinalis]
MRRQRFSNPTNVRNAKTDGQKIPSVSEAKLNQARKSGTLNLSDNQWDVIPSNVWSLNKAPTKEVGSFDDGNSAWWDQVELTKLNLSSNLLCTVPEDLQNFEFLKFLDIHDNKLQTLPNALGNLSALEHLNLSHNQLSVIQTSFNGLANLRVLLLQHNQLRELPSSLGCLQNCEKLDISHNQITTLPEEICDIKFLKDFNASFNQLNALPDNIGLLQSLRILDASNNKLKCLPDSISTLKQLEILSFRNNSLDQLPSLTLCVCLKELSLGNNRLTRFPSQLPVSVTILELRDNKLSEIPASVTELTQLERLDLANNNVPNLPPEVGAMESIKVVVVSGNPIRTISSHILNKGTQALLKHLRSRIVSNETEPLNASTGGVIPQSDSNTDLSNKHLVASSRKLDLTKENPESVTTKLALYSELPVIEVILARCSLTNIPEDLTGYKSSLSTLNIANNKLKCLPPMIGCFSQLGHLDLSGNAISALPDELAECISLREINMSYNLFTVMPGSIFKLKNLEVLVADNNQMTKIDVASLKLLAQLSTLSLQNNSINEVPPELGLFTSITTLKLEGNLFRVPRQNVLQKGTLALMDYLRSRLPNA